MRLDPAAIDAGVRLIVHDVLGSTNTEALLLARRGERGPLWIVAAAQTAGRGRQGRDWVSQPGNLYATLLLSNPAPPSRAPQLALVVALAVHDAVAEIAPGLRPRLRLKWPNDLLCDGSKLSGILIESELVERGDEPVLSVAVGIGINCRHHPADTPYPATDLAALGAPAEPADMLSVLSRTMLQRLVQWDRGAAFACIRADWLERAGPLEAALCVRTAAQEIEGRFAGLDASGRLLLRRSDGRLEAIGAGDVFPLTAMLETAAV